MTRNHFLFIAAAGLTITTLNACQGKPAKASDPDPPMQIGVENIVVAGNGTVTDGPTISGSLAAEKTAQVRAQVGGSVVAVTAEAGQHVSAGQSMGRIDAAGISDAFASAKSAVRSAQTAFDIAKRNLDRQQTLLTAGAVAPRDLEAAQQNFSAAQAGLEDAKSRLAMAQKTLENTNIIAPFSGVVSERAVSAGDVVQPGGALFTVIDPSTMRLEVSVPAERISDLRVGTPIAFTVGGYPNEQFVGKITRINPAADPTTRQVRILAAIPNSGNRLVAGLFAQGRISSRSQNGIVVPITAVDFRTQSPAILRIKNGKVERADVKLGMRDMQAETVHITNGVNVGDTLLVGAAQGITPNTTVQVQAPPADRARQ